MFRYKENYSAIIVAAIVILLCLITLTGATFALFTSNPDDGEIGIITTSGNVKVDIVDYINTDDSLVGDVLKFQVEDKDQDDVLFEPGATFYTQGFRAKNIGDVKINFRMYISNDETLDMEEFEEAFDFYITTDPENPEAAGKLLSFSDSLDPGEVSDTYFLVIKMKDDATNKFQNKRYSGIGITVCAVQGNVNIDSIGD